MSILTGLVLALTASPVGALEESRDFRFKAMLGDREIGEHRFQIGREGSAEYVVSEADFAVKFLLFKAFGYEHTSRERYDAGCLTALSARTETGGELYEVSAASDAGVLNVRSSDAATQLDGCVSTFAYWNPAQLLSQSRLLNPQTGELVEVDIVPGSETVNAGDNVANVYEINGEGLNIRVFYAAEGGDWVGLETDLENGRVLRYVPLESRAEGSVEVGGGQ